MQDLEAITDGLTTLKRAADAEMTLLDRGRQLLLARDLLNDLDNALRRREDVDVAELRLTTVDTIAAVTQAITALKEVAAGRRKVGGAVKFYSVAFGQVFVVETECRKLLEGARETPG